MQLPVSPVTRLNGPSNFQRTELTAHSTITWVVAYFAFVTVAAIRPELVGES